MDYFKECVQAAMSAGMEQEEAVDLVLSMIDDMMGADDAQSEEMDDLPEGWEEKAKQEDLKSLCAAVADEIMNPSDDEEEPEGDEPEGGEEEPEG